MPPIWKGELAGPIVPSSWWNLTTAYRRWGLSELSCWRMCIGTKNNIHDVVIFPPSDEVFMRVVTYYCIVVNFLKNCEIVLSMVQNA
jgi:hypothetical protein